MKEPHDPNPLQVAAAQFHFFFLFLFFPLSLLVAIIHTHMIEQIIVGRVQAQEEWNPRLIRR